ncbi:MAG TPA: type 1 glutamine amidotransferase [Acidimicrobiales bacterium]
MDARRRDGASRPRALVVSHDPSEVAGRVGLCLERRGYGLDVFVVCPDADRPVSHTPFPDPGAYDIVVVMGAPWSVYDTATIGTWIGRELDFVRSAHERGVPYLGICFGAQVLAAALGGDVHPAPRPEVGWGTVETTAPELIAPGPWFQWHRDRFTVPAGARELARNDVGSQAFRVGRSLGVQFHPEVDGELLRSWLPADAPVDPIFDEAGVDPARLLDETDRHAEASRPNVERLVDGFLRELAVTADTDAR